MKMDSLTISDNRFSWHRTGMTAAFYYPRVKWQIIFYPVVAMLLSLLSALLNKHQFPILLASPLNSIVTWMVYLGPLFLLNRSSREVETMLPATAKEQSVCLILYAAVLVPAITILGSWIGQTIVYGNTNPLIIFSNANLPGDTEEVKELTKAMVPYMGKSYIGGLLNLIAATLVTLTAVVKVRKNRILMAIVFVIVYNIVTTIIGTVAMLIRMFSSGFMQLAKSGNAADEAFKNLFMSTMSETFTTIAVIAAIAIVIFIPTIYRGIKNFQI